MRRTFVTLALVLVALVGLGAGTASATTGPQLAIDHAESSIAGRFVIKNVGDESATVNDVQIVSGDITWKGRDPDQCSGLVLAPEDGVCALWMEGDGTLRFTLDGIAHDLDVSATDITSGTPQPEVPSVTPPPAEGPRLAVAASASFNDGLVTIVNTGDAPVTVGSVTVVSGDLIRDAPSDSCVGRSIAPDSDSCTVGFAGVAGLVQFDLESDGDAVPSQTLRIAMTDFAAAPQPPNQEEPPGPGPSVSVDQAASVYFDGLWNLSIVGSSDITNVEALDGGGLVGRDGGDECSGAGTTPCVVHVSGATTLRFTFVGGATYDLVVADPDGEPAPDPDPETEPPVSWPPAEIWPGALVVGTVPAGSVALWQDYPLLVTGPINFFYEAWDHYGIKSIGFYVDDTEIARRNYDCEAGPSRPRDPEDPGTADCITSTGVGSWAQHFSFNSGTVSDGLHTLSVSVTSGSGRTTRSYRYRIVVDNHPPIVAVSGPLWDAQNADRFTDGTVRMLASDDGSGVTDLDLFESLAGGPSALSSPAHRSCISICSPTSLERTVSINPIALNWNDGNHNLKVRAKDVANLTTDVHWSVDFYRAAWKYGGLDDEADYAVLANDVATRSDWASIWASLRASDKAILLADPDDPLTAVISRRVDTVAPAPVDSIELNSVDSGEDTAEFTWTEGLDPDLESGVPGSGVNEYRFDYRWQRAGHPWSSFYAADENGFTLENVEPGDVVTIQVSEYDVAGNLSGPKYQTFTIPADSAAPGGTATPRVAIAIPLIVECAFECVTIAVSVGALVGDAFGSGDHSWDGRRRAEEADINVIGPVAPPSAEQKEWDAIQVKERSKARALLLKSGKIPRDKRRANYEAHHIIAVKDKRADEARYVARVCGLKLNEEYNLVALPKKFHRQVHQRGYFHAVNALMAQFNPKRTGISSCAPGGFNEGPRQALRDFGKALMLQSLLPTPKWNLPV